MGDRHAREGVSALSALSGLQMLRITLPRFSNAHALHDCTELPRSDTPLSGTKRCESLRKKESARIHEGHELASALRLQLWQDMKVTKQ